MPDEDETTQDADDTEIDTTEAEILEDDGEEEVSSADMFDEMK